MRLLNVFLVFFVFISSIISQESWVKDILEEFREVYKDAEENVGQDFMAKIGFIDPNYSK